MHKIKSQMQLCTALLLVVTIFTSILASVGTSYARYSYTGQNQVVLFSEEEETVTSNILMPQGCTVLLNSWDVDNDCQPQEFISLFKGKGQKGRVEYTIPEEIQDYFVFSVFDGNGNPLFPANILSVDGDTNVKFMVEPVEKNLIRLTDPITLSVDFEFIQLIDSTDENGAPVLIDGQRQSCRIQWDVIPSANPQTRPEIPTATVTEIKKHQLTFALNFKADPATEEQLEFYGPWYADFVLTVNKDVTLNANGNADGWLSGQYDAWSENWVNVPFEDVVLKAGESIKIMEYAAELMGQQGLKFTYEEVYNSVQDFDCGVFFDSEFLQANPDLEVTLELRMYNPEDEKESYTVGETYLFKLEKPEIPTATVTEIENDRLTFALNFKADEVSGWQMDYYGDWYADFELKVSQDVVFNANDTADGWLSGQYDAWSENWVNVPFEDVTLKAGDTIKIMEYAAELMGQPGLKFTYEEVFLGVQDFDCGVFFDDDYLIAHPDLKVSLELRMYNPQDENESYVIGETYQFTPDRPQPPKVSASVIENEELTIAMNFAVGEAGKRQLRHYGNWITDFEISFNKDITLHGNGSADGWLSGQLDLWDDEWVKMPLTAVSLNKGQTFNILQYASEIINKPNKQYTFAELYEGLKDFDCGVFLSNGYILNNPDLEITLCLRMYNPENPAESCILGDTYKFNVEVTQAPSAAGTVINMDDLTFAMNFATEQVTDKQMDYYGTWYTDFEITLNKPVTFHGNGSADGWLAGQLDLWGDNWVKIPFEGMSLNPGQSFKVMEYASRLIEPSSRPYTFEELYEGLKEFDCGVYFTPEYLRANPDLQVKLELRMYNPYDAADTRLIGQTYTFNARDISFSELQNLPEAETRQQLSPVALNMAAALKPMIMRLETEEADENQPVVPVLSMADMKNLALINDTFINVYSTINYPADMREMVITSGDGFAPFTQVHTTDMVYILPYGGSYTISVTADTAGTEYLLIVSEILGDGAAPESVNTTLVCKYDDGQTRTSSQQSYCSVLGDTDFGNDEPKTEILTANRMLKFFIPPTSYSDVTFGTGCIIDFFNGTEYVAASEKDFAIRLSGDKTYFSLTTGETYPQAGVYRVGYMLQAGNILSLKYKTFFINYR